VFTQYKKIRNIVRNKTRQVEKRNQNEIAKNEKVIQNISGSMLNQKELVKNQLVTYYVPIVLEMSFWPPQMTLKLKFSVISFLVFLTMKRTTV